MLDMEEAQERSRKLAKLRQYTSDQAILDKVDSVAFDQEDLADLLDNDVHDIYLCNNSFVIPLRVENKKYIGIGKAEAVIKSEEWVDFAAKKIVYENVEFDAAYEKVYAESAEGLFALGSNANFRLNDYNLAAEYYQKSFEKGSEYALLSLAELYEFTGDKNFRDMGKAIYWYTKMADAGDPYGMVKLAELYATGGKERKAQKYIEVDEEKARYWLEKAAETGDPFGMFALADHLKDGTYGCEKNFSLALSLFIKCANTGNPDSIRYMGDLYAGGRVKNSPLSDVATAFLWYEKALASESMPDYRKPNVWCCIGDLYAKGGFGDSERRKALKWYRMALEHKSNYVPAEIRETIGLNDSEDSIIDTIFKWHKDRDGGLSFIHIGGAIK